MKKIPTIFERDWNGDRSRVLDEQNPDCSWVFAGEGIATRKLDGTSCLMRNGKLYKRREIRKGDIAPPHFEVADIDEETGKTVGWVPVGDDPQDRYHHEALARAGETPLTDGTYELIGPKVQGNPEHATDSVLIRHGSGMAGAVGDVPLTFRGLKEWLSGKDIEGLVWHHPDGRMAKIKLRDFGMKRSLGGG
jgi:hypothetical protein